MQIEVPSIYTEVKKNSPIVLQDKTKVKELQEILKDFDKDTVIVLNFNGKYGQRKKTLHVDSQFLKLLPTSGSFIINFNDFDFVSFSKDWDYYIDDIQNLTLNFNNCNWAEVSINPESAENKGIIQNLTINSNASLVASKIYNSNIKNLKITSEEKEYEDTFWLENLAGAETIDLSEHKQLSSCKFSFSNINKNAKWFLPNNVKIENLTWEKYLVPAYYNRIRFAQGQNNASGKTTEELKKIFLQAKKLL